MLRNCLSENSKLEVQISIYFTTFYQMDSLLTNSIVISLKMNVLAGSNFELK